MSTKYLHCIFSMNYLMKSRFYWNIFPNNNQKREFNTLYTKKIKVTNCYKKTPCVIF
jgi:hypothetical protein